MKSTAFNDISEFIDQISIFDTHEHVAGFDWGFSSEAAPIGPCHPRQKSLPHVLMNDMLLYIISSTGIDGSHLSPDQWQVEQAHEYWQAMQPVLEVLRNTTVYTMIRRGIKELYGFEGDEITDENFGELNEKIVATYHEKSAPAWLLEVLRKAQIETIIQMAHLPYLIEYWPSLPEERRRAEQKVVRPSLVLEPFFFSGFQPDRTRARQRTMELLNIFPQNYSEHLQWMHAAVKRHKQESGVAVKFICAYQRSLKFESVPDDEAQKLYDRNPANLDELQLQRLQDNLVWHLVRFAKEFNLPVQIHSGYATPTSWGHPENLLNLVTNPDFSDVNFYFAHAGWPHDGAMAIMARGFANVHFGFCWIPGLSPALAERMMSEVIDLVPANKMLIGMDSGSIESLYGITLTSREILTKVLADKVDSGWLSRQTARTVAERMLRGNAAQLFGC